MAGTLHAGEPAPAEQAAQIQVAPALPNTPLPVGAERTTVEPKQIDIIMVGGITKPGEAEWIDDDTSLPDLPMVREPNFSQQKS